MTAPSRMRTAFAAASILVIGAAVGIAADRAVHGRGDPHAALFAEIQKDPIGVMDRELRLRPEQRARIAEVLARRQMTVDSAWSAARAHLNATLDSVVNEISAALDPDQARRFREMAHEVHGTPLRR